MAKAHIEVPSLIGGVSQQPPANRLDNQAEAIFNAWLSPIDGLIPRGHTEHVAQLYSGKTGFNHWHTINRSQEEQYAVRVHHNGLAVYDLNGTEVPVRWNSSNYLATPTMLSAGGDWVFDAGVASAEGGSFGILEPNPLGGLLSTPAYEQASTAISSSTAGARITQTLRGDNTPGLIQRPFVDGTRYLFGVWVKNHDSTGGGLAPCRDTAIKIGNGAGTESTTIVIDWTNEPTPMVTKTSVGTGTFHEVGIEERAAGWYIVWTAFEWVESLSTDIEIEFLADTFPLTTSRIYVWHAMLEVWDDIRRGPGPVWVDELTDTAPTFPTRTRYLNYSNPKNILGDVERNVGSTKFAENSVLSWQRGATAATAAATAFLGPFGGTHGSNNYEKLSNAAAAPSGADYFIDRGSIGVGYQTMGCYFRKEAATAAGWALSVEDTVSGQESGASFLWTTVGGADVLTLTAGSLTGAAQRAGVVQSPYDPDDWMAWVVLHPNSHASVTPGNARRCHVYVDDQDAGATRDGYASAPFLFEASRRAPDFFEYMAPLQRANSLTVNDFTFLTNPTRHVQRYYSDAPDLPLETPIKNQPLTTPADQTDTRVYFFVKIGGADAEYVVRLFFTDGTFIEHHQTTWDGNSQRQKCVGGWGDTMTECTSNGGVWQSAQDDNKTFETNQIAAHLAYELDLDPDITAIAQGSVVEARITPGSTKLIDYVETDDSFGDTALFPIHHDVEHLDDLPKVFRDGWRVGVRGAADEDFPTTVRFVSDHDQFGDIGEGEWVEATNWETEDTIDANTMPLQLIRRQDNKNGFFTGVPDSIYFEVGPLLVEKRLVGDEETNPFPAFVSLPNGGLNRTISDAYFFEGRFGLLSEEALVLSEVNRYFNFFRTTDFDVIDSDPVSASASHTEVALLNDAFVLDERLLIVSDRNQFIVEGDPTLTPQTITITPKLSLENYPDVALVGSGRGAYMAFPKQGFKDGPAAHSGVREVRPSSANGLELVGDDITDAVPSFITGEINELVSSTTVDVLLVVGVDGRLYPFKTFTQGGQTRQQAWSEWTFGEAAVKHAAFVQTETALILDRGPSAGTFLETMLVGDGLEDPGLGWRIRLDRRVDESSVPGTYDIVNDATTFVLPYAISANAEVKCVDRDTGNDFAILSTGGSTVVVQGDRTADNLFFGELYTMAFTFTEPVARTRSADGSNRVAASGRTLVLGGKISYADSSHFKVTVSHEYGDAEIQEFNSAVLSTGDGVMGTPVLDTGEIEFGVGAFPNEVLIEISTSSYLPCQILNALWEVKRNPRSRSLRG